jgi:hypothetical protein
VLDKMAAKQALQSLQASHQMFTIRTKRKPVHSIGNAPL